MKEIVYEAALSGKEYNYLRESVGWERLSDRQAEQGLAHTTFMIAARHLGAIAGIGRVLFDY